MLREQEDHAAHKILCDQDAAQIAAKYDLPCKSMLSRAMYSMYRHPPFRNGTEYEDGVALDPHTIERFRAGYAAIQSQVAELSRLMDMPMRRAVPFVLETLDPADAVRINQALVAICYSRPLDSPLDSASAFLPKHIANLGSYLLFVLDEGPRMFDSDGIPTAHRALVGETLAITGWSYQDDQINQHCRELQCRLSSSKGSSCGLRRQRWEREEAADWRARRKLTKSYLRLVHSSESYGGAR